MSAINRPPLRWFGGKHRIASWIIGHFPRHTTYLEPFGGGASVLIQKAPAPVEVYNDLDQSVVNFFRVLRDQPAALIRVLALTPYARSEHDLARELSDDPVEAARRFYVLCWQSFASGSRPKTRSHYWRSVITNHSSLIENWRDVDRLQVVADRLLGVQIENSDAFELMPKYDTPYTLHYLDPPYPREVRIDPRPEYAFEMLDPEPHIRMAEVVHRLQGFVVISGYDTPLYQQLFAGWHRLAKNTISMSNSPREEVIWLSPRCELVQQRLL